MRCVIWIEGVDFSETLYDTEKLSVVRGASRALEAMPVAAENYFKSKKLEPEMIMRGASIAVFIVTADETLAKACLDEFKTEVLQKAKPLDDIKKRCVEIGPTSGAKDYIAAAPFAHLKFQSAIVPFNDEAEIENALKRAHAKIRAQQLRQPGGVIAESSVRETCEFDHTRARAATETRGPPKTSAETSSRYGLSEATAARWHYGRMQRQMLYLEAGIDADFVNDFQTMVAHQPTMPDGSKLPVSVQNKLAVFVADGDKFGAVRGALAASYGSEIGNKAFAGILRKKMNALLFTLVKGLQGIVGENVATVEEYVAANKKVTRLRFETILFGGDDMTFVVPAWLGWWLALEFFKATADWKISAADVETEIPDCEKKEFVPHPLVFSAGLLFANCKTPIRSLRNLADELCRSAKDGGGGLDVEVLESIEPPHGGIFEHRKRLSPSGLANIIPRAELSAKFLDMQAMWNGDDPFPASQAHRVLRLALNDYQLDESKNQNVCAALKEYVAKAGSRHQPLLQCLNFLEAAPTGDEAKRLYHLLQQRDYVRRFAVTK